MSPLLELATVPLVLLLAWRLGASKALRPARRWFARLARRRRLAVVLTGAAVAVACAAVTLAHGWPSPHFQDEYSYLLMADTFAHGRLSNPPHPLWEHLETFQIIQQPTYASKYPPAQGLVLAAGRLLTGEPMVGVWLSMGLAAAALCWMLQAWFPPRWALLGALLLTARLVCSWHIYGTHDHSWGYWARGYMGGGVAVLGGALLYGGLRRLIERRRPAFGLAIGAGLVLLANSRPFEGLLVSLPALAVLAWVGLREPAARRGIALAAALLLPAAGLMAAYNRAVTGDPLRMPYQIHEATYGANPMFVWQKAGEPPAYRHEVMATFHARWVRDQFVVQKEPLGFLLLSGLKAFSLLTFYLGVWLSVALLALRGARRRPWVSLAGVAVLVVLAGLAQVFCLGPHYAAPAAGVLAVLVVAGLRQLHAAGRRHRLCRGLVPAVVLSYPVLLLISGLIDPGTPADASHVQRQELLDRLTAQGGRHLVVVRYVDPPVAGHEDWVFNEADVDASAVVWAREIGPDEDRRLLEYFADRRRWIVQVDVPSKTYRLEPHPLLAASPPPER